MKSWWRAKRPYILSGLIFFITRIIGRTLRIRPHGWDEAQAVEGGKIYVGWHGRSFIPANFFKGRGVWCIISLSRDGELQTRIFTRYGFQIIRGSTGRGGERALVEAIRALKKGGEMAITPDGPRGPEFIVQPGVMMMARKSGCSLIPVGTAAKPCSQAPTWDHYMVPWLFAKATFVFREPIRVPADATEEDVEVIRLHLQDEINKAQQDAERLI